MENKINFEEWENKFDDLGFSERFHIFKCYCSDNCCDKEVFYFDEDFFDCFFEDKMEVCRATFFGNIDSWYDPYIRFNGYGNLESLSEAEVEDIIDGYKVEMYDYPDCWMDYYE